MAIRGSRTQTNAHSPSLTARAAQPRAGRFRPPDPLTAWATVTYALLIALAGVAWVGSSLRMSGMDDGPGTALGTFSFFLVTWVVMMAAMMFPSIAPMVATYVRIQRRRRATGLPAATGGSGLFVGGYLLIWSVAGAVAYVLNRGVGGLAGDRLSWNHGGRWVAAAVLMVAALYELTPWKQACLTRCRTPVSFFVTSWRDGRRGALRMGVLHGAWCLGCCWALMGALFALGVMSLAWMALIGTFIALEKLLPWRRSAVASVGVVLAVLAFGVGLAPGSVPGLHAPGSSMSTK
jgi:predicted metal-binding membrane protein